MKRDGHFVHQLAVPRRGSDWHILRVGVIYHAKPFLSLYSRHKTTMKRNGHFVHQLAVPRRGSDWHILRVGVIYHANHRHK